MSETTQRRSRCVTILSAITALVFLASGAMKLVGAEPEVATFERFGFGTGFMRFIGAAEVAGAIGLFLPRLAPLAAAGLVVVAGSAAVQHSLHDSLTQALPATVQLVLCAFLAWSRRGELLGRGTTKSRS